MNRRRIVPLLLAATTAGLAGCHHKKEKKVQQSPKGLKLGLVLARGTTPFDKSVVSAASDTAKNQGIDLTVETAGGRASEQTRALEQLLQQGVNGLIVEPLDPAQLKPTLEKAAGAKVGVVTINRDAPDAEVGSFVEYNQDLSGQLAADYLGFRIKSGKVAVLADASSPTPEGQQARIKAFQEYLKTKFPAITVAGQEMAADGAARPAVDRLTHGTPGLKAIFATTDALGLEAARALKGGSEGNCIVVSYGGSPESVAALKQEGSALGLVIATLPQQLGRMSVRTAGRLLTNRRVSGHRQLRVFPVTATNYGSYPGYEDEPPRDFPIPWPSTLTLEQPSGGGGGGGGGGDSGGE